jgi:hypothetical protein
LSGATKLFAISSLAAWHTYRAMIAGWTKREK